MLGAGCAGGGVLQPALFLPGEAVQGALLRGQAPPGSRVLYAGRELRVSADGWFVFGLGRDADVETALELQLPGAEPRRYRLEVAPRSWRTQHVEGVPPRTVSPPAEALPRIAREREAIVRARARDSGMSFFREAFTWPVEGPISGVFGSQRTYNGVPRRPHYGVDIAVPTGTPVRAPAPGTVRLAQPDMFFSGGTVILDHGHGVHSSYLHLHALHVTEGERVERGALIAEVGATGRATGAHLHWQINWFQLPVDPELLLAPQSKFLLREMKR